MQRKLKDKDSLIAEIMEDNIRLKKAECGHLRGMWVVPDIRDAVVEYVGKYEYKKCTMKNQLFDVSIFA